MIAKLENDIINVYDENNILIGGIKSESNFKKSQIIIGDKTYQLSRNKRKAEVFENEKVIYNLNMNSFFGNAKIEETGNKITGVFGFKWGTKMVDKEKNTLLKIRTENQFVNTNKYEIEKSSEEVSALEILTTLYAHLYGSSKKMIAALITSTILTTIIIRSGIFS